MSPSCQCAGRFSGLYNALPPPGRRSVSAMLLIPYCAPTYHTVRFSSPKWHSPRITPRMGSKCGFVQYIKVESRPAPRTSTRRGMNSVLENRYSPGGRYTTPPPSRPTRSSKPCTASVSSALPSPSAPFRSALCTTEGQGSAARTVNGCGHRPQPAGPPHPL